ncbi:hypothetical protein MUN78_16480 [Leucobacter allii]|uniref:Uncharacterized protein n=1 Tax=Leucobacter allii TaxID=2932247 RepID=A0ABY4FLR5_9MICO|nr:hypothetical protein [Leucobacter allii]UOQ57227.1 hypothetical protein MUN78_16480 [Leucobacter allii]
MSGLSARFDDGLWTVVDRAKGRWWTSTSKDLDAHITNEKLRPIKANSPLGVKIRFAIAAAEADDE